MYRTAYLNRHPNVARPQPADGYITAGRIVGEGPQKALSYYFAPPLPPAATAGPNFPPRRAIC